MRIALRGLVVLIGVMLLLIALNWMVAPSSLATRFWVDPSSIAGFATLRGDLGGLFLGCAVFTFLGALPSRTR